MRELRESTGKQGRRGQTARIYILIGEKEAGGEGAGRRDTTGPAGNILEASLLYIRYAVAIPACSVPLDIRGKIRINRICTPKVSLVVRM